MALQLEIVTPEKRVLAETVDSVVVPGSEGQLGILTSHVPLVTALKPGELSFTQAGKSTTLAIGTGFVEVSGDKVSVLTDMALGEQEIDEKVVEEALARAQERLAGLSNDQSSEEFLLVQASIQKSLAQLGLKRRRHQI